MMNIQTSGTGEPYQQLSLIQLHFLRDPSRELVHTRVGQSLKDTALTRNPQSSFNENVQSLTPMMMRSMKSGLEASNVIKENTSKDFGDANLSTFYQQDKYPFICADDTRKDTLVIERITDEGSGLNLRDAQFE